jgi:hypothetical protein
MRNLLWIIAAFIMMSSCEKQLEQNGPELCPEDGFTSDSVQLIGLEDNIINVENEGLNIKADFGNKVAYSITIQSGNAVKSYNNSASRINIHWYGNSDNLPLFSAGEATITIDITCVGKISKTFTIEGETKLSGTNPNFGTLIRDYDGNGIAPVNTNNDTITPGTEGYFYGNIESWWYTDIFPSPMGGRALQINGKYDNGASGWYFGANAMPGLGGMFDNFPTNNPDSLYFNAFVRKGDFGNTNAEFVLTTSNDGSYLYTTPVNWEGWQLVSAPLSAFRKGGEPLTTTDNITEVAMQLGAATMPDDEQQIYYDFIIITHNEPLFK